MTTYTLPQNLGDILGAHHDGNFNTQVSEIKAGIGVLLRGTVLASGAGADIGKLVKLSATTEASAYGILLDPAWTLARPIRMARHGLDCQERNIQRFGTHCSCGS